MWEFMISIKVEAESFWAHTQLFALIINLNNVDIYWAYFEREMFG